MLDKGDLTNTGPFCVECKNTKTIELASAVDQAQREAINAEVPYGIAVIKRVRKPVKDAYVVLSLGTFTQLLDDMTAVIDGLLGDLTTGNSFQ